MLSIPHDVTEVEKRAFYDLIKESNVKAKKIMVVEKAVADGLGMDIDVKNSQGVLVVDIGFDTTEISILSLGGIVLSKLIKTGGKKFVDYYWSSSQSSLGSKNCYALGFYFVDGDIIDWYKDDNENFYTCAVRVFN